MPSAVERTAKSLVLERSSLYAELTSGINVSASLFYWVRVLFTDRAKKGKFSLLTAFSYLNEQVAKAWSVSMLAKAFIYEATAFSLRISKKSVL